MSDDAMMMAVLTALFCGMLCGFIAFSKDRSWLGFALLGVLLGPIGLVMTGFAEPASSIMKITREDRETSKATRLDRASDDAA